MEDKKPVDQQVVVKETHRFDVTSAHMSVNSIDDDPKMVKVQIFEHGNDTRPGPIIMPLIEFIRVANALRQYDKTPVTR